MHFIIGALLSGFGSVFGCLAQKHYEYTGDYCSLLSPSLAATERRIPALSFLLEILVLLTLWLQAFQ